MSWRQYVIMALLVLILTAAVIAVVQLQSIGVQQGQAAYEACMSTLGVDRTTTDIQKLTDAASRCQGYR